MQLLSISDDQYQTFEVQLDAHSVHIHVRCPENHSSLKSEYTEIPPVIDVYISGYDPVYGIPLSPFVDILGDYVSSGCLPRDLGALMPLPNQDGVITCDSLAEGECALAYFNSAESVGLGLF